MEKTDGEGNERRQTLSKRTRQVLLWGSIALACVCIAAVGQFAFAKVSLGALGLLPRFLLVGLLLLFVSTSLVLNKEIPWRSSNVQEWLKPKVIASIAVSSIGIITSMNGMFGIIVPPKVNESQKEISTGVKEIAQRMGVGSPSLIRQRIAGVWGEHGCKLTYRFVLNDQSLSMTSLRDPPGIARYKGIYTINMDSDRPGPAGEHLSVMETREEEGWFPGFNVTFTYSTNGTTERLYWDHRKMNVNGTYLVRCRAQG